MQEKSIQAAVNFVSECGPRTKAIIQLKLDEEGNISINCDSQLMELCFMRECLSDFVREAVSGTRGKSHPSVPTNAN